MKCNVCPNNCNIDRSINVGRCKVNNIVKVARSALHFFEEPIISGINGSGTIFFSGCPLNCKYCQNYEISKNAFGKEITVEQLADLYKKLENQNAENINLVSPTQFTEQIIESFEIYKPKIPIVWNTSGYETQETLIKLKNYVDIYLTDYKYSSNDLAKFLSGINDYPTTAFDAIKTMINNQPNIVIDNGLMKKGVIIRHLVIPSQLENTKNCLQQISTLEKTNYILSVMAQFTPNGKCNIDYLNRKLTKLELKYVESLLDKYNLDGFIQDLESANEQYIPPFDLSGLD